ncbi:MAG TPA: HAD-IIIA family hydrolase [Aeromonadales bacterium]|nr:HAD-IIIA family hydrolase [Aeromonadales bacterium]
MSNEALSRENIQQLAEKARKIKLVITDVDGVLTDGKVFLDQTENELKSFNIKDGLGIKLLMQQNITVAVITGRQSQIVKRRMAELNVTEVHQNQPDKRQCFASLMEKFDLEVDDIAYLGDDLPDLPLIKQCGLGVCVADGHWFVQQQADWVTSSRGGDGAFRELAELILGSQNLLPDILEGYQH